MCHENRIGVSLDWFVGTKTPHTVPSTARVDHVVKVVCAGNKYSACSGYGLREGWDKPKTIYSIQSGFFLTPLPVLHVVCEFLGQAEITLS